MDQQAFTEFYNATNALLFSYVLKSCENPSLSEDIMQESYLKFLSRPPRHEAFRARKAYLYTIANRLLTDHYRAEAKQKQAMKETMKTTAPEAESPHETDRPAQAAIKKMSYHDKTLLWLAYVEGYDHKEIAGMMNLKPKSIRVLLFRARQRFKEFFAQKINK